MTSRYSREQCERRACGVLCAQWLLGCCLGAQHVQVRWVVRGVVAVSRRVSGEGVSAHIRCVCDGCGVGGCSEWTGAVSLLMFSAVCEVLLMY